MKFGILFNRIKKDGEPEAVCSFCKLPVAVMHSIEGDGEVVYTCTACQKLQFKAVSRQKDYQRILETDATKEYLEHQEAMEREMKVAETE